MNRERLERMVLGHIAREPRDATVLWSDAQAVRWTGEHIRIADAIGRVLGRGAVPDLLAVAVELNGRGQGELTEAFAATANEMSFGAEAERLVQLLLEEDRRERMRLDVRAVLDELGAGDDPTVAAERLHRIASIGCETPKKQPLHEPMKAVVQRVATRMQRSLEGDEDAVPYIASSFADFNRLIGGFRIGLWTVIAARPKMGKTSLWEQEVVWQARRGRGVIVCSLEMAPDEHVERMALRESDCRRELAALYKRIGQDDRQGMADVIAYHKSLAELVELPIRWVRSTTRRGLDQVLADLSSALQSCPEPPALVVVDYVQLVRPSQRYQRADLGFADVSMALCEWLNSAGLAGILVAQLNRSVEKENRPPRASDLRECGQLEQDAGAVCFVHRPNKGSCGGDERESCELLVDVARFGSPGRVPLWFTGRLMRFEAQQKTPAWM